MYVLHVYEYEFIDGRNHPSGAHILVSPPWLFVCMCRLHLKCSVAHLITTVQDMWSTSKSVFISLLYIISLCLRICLLTSFPERATVYTAQRSLTISTKSTRFWQNSLNRKSI